MSASTPSAAAVDALLNGQTLKLSSGKVIVEQLGANAIRLLKVLWEGRVELCKHKGNELATRMYSAYLATPHALPHSSADVPGATGSATVSSSSTVSPRWRLIRLRCHSIRGIAPLGETFEFHFEGVPTLIYGPNGTGKSSLITAIGWVFTGKAVTDSEEEIDEVPLYTLPKPGGSASKKLCDWPVIHTLPHGANPKNVVPDCSAEVHLRSHDGTRTLHLRRSKAGLQASNDGENWRECPDLATHGISPLDVQLSISAATVFGRRSLETSPDTRHLLSMMLGYDALEEVGVLVTGLTTALTKTVNAEREEVGIKAGRLREKLRGLPLVLREGHALRASLNSFTPDAPVTPEKIVEVQHAATGAIDAAEAELAALLNLGTSPTTGLADAISAGITTLARPLTELFPMLGDLDPTRFTTTELTPSPSDVLTDLSERFAAFERRARERIASRLDWWRQESESGSRASLLVHAAHYFDPTAHECPVCEQSVRGKEVEKRLLRLRAVATDSRVELRVFFRDLTDELGGLAPNWLLALGKVEPTALLRAGWGKLKGVLGPALATLVVRYEPKVLAATEGLPPFSLREVDLCPLGAEQEFGEACEPFLEAFRAAWRAMGVAEWSVAHHTTLADRLARVLTSSDDGDSSLSTALARGKDAAADVAPLRQVHDGLAKAAVDASEVVGAEKRMATLTEIRSAVDEIKNLGKYAEGEVELVFGGIRDKTAEYLASLYPNSNPDLSLTRLHLNKGRDKSVEAYLKADTFEFPGHPVANAGFQRAVALAFYFAILGRHPGGLGFVVMDDPILSLDDNHREAWSANVLKPCLSATQVILTTHQRQFLNNCRPDFTPGRLVELNPRTTSRRITWRPGDRLDRAVAMMDTDWINAAAEMRKYREELLITFDAYSPTPFFNRKNLTDSFTAYAGFSPPHPLAGSNIRIAAALKEGKITSVLDPALHAMTEADVTESMVRGCLAELQKIDQMFKKEVERLEDLRLRDLRAKTVNGAHAPPSPEVGAEESSSPQVTIPFELLRVGDERASWAEGLSLSVIGTAAAQTRGCVVDLADHPQATSLPPGGAVLVVGDGLSPLARTGQWAMLAKDDEIVGDGDYAAVIDQAGNRYLRRIWSEKDSWLLETINPLASIPPTMVRKCASKARKVIGICFVSEREPKPGGGRGINEWHPRQDFTAHQLGGLSGITVRGTSLEPIAASGHVVLVGQKVTGFTGIDTGMLAVVETDDELVGNVIKRVYPQDRALLLVSPNSVEPREPLLVTRDKLRAVWPVRGVLFEVSKQEPLGS